MFTGFKVLRRKSEERKKDNRKSSSKWSLDRALCQGNSERVTDSPSENAREGVIESWQPEVQYGQATMTRVVGVALERDERHGLGINLRPSINQGPLIVTHVKPFGPAESEGTIRVGDRVLAVDGRRLSGLSLTEAQSLLTRKTKPTWLTVEYDVSDMSHLRSTGLLLVEIESVGTKNQIGLGLIDSSGGVIVSKLKTASIAERCGAFVPGDQILAINDFRVENSKLTAKDVNCIIEESTAPVLQIEILPVSASIYRCPSPAYDTSNYSEFDNSFEAQNEIRIESGLVTLQLPNNQSFGIVFRSAPSKKGVVVCYLEPESVADKSGVLQVGDRIILANGRPICDRTRLEDLGLIVHLSVQFDLEVYPKIKDGLKSVKLTRSPGSGFGVTITEADNGIVVSEVKWGSVAHRSGRVFAGDALVGIDNTRVTDISIATRVFKSCSNQVIFHLLPGEGNTDLGYSSPGLPSVDSAVESWDSSYDRNNAYLNNDILDWHIESTRESLTTSVTHQSDDEETCSSFRLSEGNTDTQGNIAPLPPSPPCPLQTNYNLRKTTLPVHWRGSSMNDTGLDAVESQVDPCPTTERSFSTFRGPETQKSQNVFQVTLYKSLAFDDFGFSVSDGLYEKGVFVNTIKPGSPADLCNLLRPYDKIIQVNDVPTHDLDCCMTVPLMATAGKKLTLTIVRYQDKNPCLRPGKWIDEPENACNANYRKTETL